MIYVSIYYHADQEAIAAYSADISVEEQVLPDGSLRFGTGREEYGLIFYPGGKVEHEAYKPLMRTLAEKGVFCVVCKMPFRLAVLDRDAADGIRDAYPEIRHWYLGGHSLGGAMAASYLSEHSGDYDGLILLAAYSTADLTGSGCRVLSLYGSEDGVLNRKDYTKNRSNLPADTRETVIPGRLPRLFRNVRPTVRGRNPGHHRRGADPLHRPGDPGLDAESIVVFRAQNPLRLRPQGVPVYHHWISVFFMGMQAATRASSTPKTPAPRTTQPTGRGMVVVVGAVL